MTSCRLPSQGIGSARSLARVSTSVGRLRFFLKAMMQRDGARVTSAPVQSSVWNRVEAVERWKLGGSCRASRR